MTEQNRQAKKEIVETLNRETGRINRKEFWTVRDENGNVIGRSPRKWEAEQEAASF